jgi:hypothetical protein
MSAYGTKLLNARALVCPEELAKADMRPFRRDSAFDPGITRSILLCCTTQLRDAFCRNDNASRLSRPMMWNKLVFAERNVMEYSGLPR